MGMCFLIILVILAILSEFIYDYQTDIIGLNPTAIYAKAEPGAYLWL